MSEVFCTWLLIARRPLEIGSLWLEYAPELSFDAFVRVLKSFNVRMFLDDHGSLFAYRSDVVPELLRIASLLHRDVEVKDLALKTMEVYHGSLKVSDYLGARIK